VKIAIASSYGLPAAGVERAFEAGVRWFFWGALRHGDFGAALRRLGRLRERPSIAIVSYARHPLALRASVELARRRLGVDCLDLVVLGFAKADLPLRLVDVAVSLRASGAVRQLGVSSHDREWLAATGESAPWLDAVMARYSAAHPDAERSVFPRCGDRLVLSYTATRWGTLIDPSRTPPGERTPTAEDCYRFVLSNPRVDLCLAGPRDVTELGAALAAGRAAPMSPDEQAWMRRVGAHVRATAKVPEARGDFVRRVGRAVKSLVTRGVTEEVVSRFNR
jgi:aryl-alcohol dehydrogenase-like predicted oxidoreductase